MYFTDRGIEELDDRRGDEQVSFAWLAERLRDYVDDHPEAEATIDGLASWLARLDDEDDDLDLLVQPAGESSSAAGSAADAAAGSAADAAVGSAADTAAGSAADAAAGSAADAAAGSAAEADSGG